MPTPPTRALWDPTESPGALKPHRAGSAAPPLLWHRHLGTGTTGDSGGSKGQCVGEGGPPPSLACTCGRPRAHITRKEMGMEGSESVQPERGDPVQG